MSPDSHMKPVYPKKFNKIKLNNFKNKPKVAKR